MALSTKPKYLTIKELKQYPADALAKVRAAPSPTETGRATVGKGRGKTFELYYETFGTGDIKILWISGHGAGIEDFYRHVKNFGLDGSGRYTSVLLENRGVGRSGGTWSYCTMKDLAHDTLEVLDHLGWNEERSVHVIGHSMGGMMAMRLALLDPVRIASLILVSTTSHWLGDLSLLNSAKTVVAGLMPKSQDTRMAEVRAMLFGQEWLDQSDNYGVFPTNADAWLARALEFPVHYKGAIISAPACVKHHVLLEELRTMVAKVGSSRIQIIHGNADRIAPVSAAEKIWAGCGGIDSGVQLHILEGVGHMAPVEGFTTLANILLGMME